MIPLPMLAAMLAQSQPLPEALDAGWKGQKVCEVLRDDDSMRIGRCTFPPGVGHERHRHRPHWGYIVQGGTMRITDSAGTVERTLNSGSSWWSDGTDWHEVLNIGAVTSIYLIIEPKTAR